MTSVTCPQCKKQIGDGADNCPDCGFSVANSEALQATGDLDRGGQCVGIRKYCIQCRYPLFGLIDSRCPECGQTFDPNDPTTYLKTDRYVNPIHILVAMLIWAAASGGQFEIFVDIPSLLWIGGVSVGGLWMCFGPATTVRAFIASVSGSRRIDCESMATYLLVFARAYQLAWGAGLIGMLIGMIIMLANMDDPSSIGTGLAYALLVVLYGAVLAEFILAPLQQSMASRSGLSALNMPFIAVPHRSVQAVALAAVFAVVVIVLIVTAWQRG